MADLNVKTNVKDALAGNAMSADLYGALDAKDKEMLDDAARRADANDRKTVQARNFLMGRR